MEPDETLRAARDRAEALLADGARVLDQPLRLECADFLGDLPEPPHTRRPGDERGGAARARLLQGRLLLARLVAAREQGAVGVGALERAVVAAIRLHADTSEGRLADAEVAWVEARREAQVALSPFRIWGGVRRLRPAFDPATGRSRYDAGGLEAETDEAPLELKLECPGVSCARLGRFRPVRDPEPQTLRCLACGARFSAWFLEALGSPTSTAGRRTFPARTCDGVEVLPSVADEGEGRFAVAAGDLLAFVGRQADRWDAVENLATGGRLRAASGGPCFLVTAIYGADAPELSVFRAFRDRALLPHAVGRQCVALYYRVGPWLAREMRRSAWLAGVARRALGVVHERLRARGYGR